MKPQKIIKRNVSYSPKQLKNFKLLLEAEKKEYSSNIKTLVQQKEDLLDQIGSQKADIGEQASFGQSLEILLQELATLTRYDLLATKELHTLTQKPSKFGRCGCGKLIQIKRKEAALFTNTCMQCMNGKGARPKAIPTSLEKNRRLLPLKQTNIAY